MRKTLNVILGSILVVLLFACDQKTGSVDAQVMKQELQASAEFKNFRGATKGLMAAYASGEISFKGADQSAVSKALTESKSEAEFAERCRQAGVKGSAKYAELMFRQREAQLELIRKNPDLKKLSPEELRQVLDFNIQLDPDDLN